MGDERTSLRELALLFLRLGVISFGGPAAHIAMMRDEVVVRRNWLSEERFIDLLGATQLIPGPNSTEMAIHIGWARRRWLGLFIAGVSFILPAVFLTGVLGNLYVRFGTLPEVSWLFDGIRPAILAIVVQATVAMVPVAARTGPTRLLGLLVVLASALGGNELMLLLGAGLVMAAWQSFHAREDGPKIQQTVVACLPMMAAASVGAVPITLPGIFGIFFKIGAVLFGSGYVLLAFLRAELVERLHWLTESQLVDAVAAGQVTPGPVFSTATFVGYLLAGPWGAAVATVAIFLPAFVFVALSGPLIPRLRAAPVASAFLDGVNAASLALMALVVFQLGKTAIVDVPTALVALMAAVALLRFKINSTWIVAIGALVGIGRHWLS